MVLGLSAPGLPLGPLLTELFMLLHGLPFEREVPATAVTKFDKHTTTHLVSSCALHLVQLQLLERVTCQIVCNRTRFDGKLQWPDHTGHQPASPTLPQLLCCGLLGFDIAQHINGNRLQHR